MISISCPVSGSGEFTTCPALKALLRFLICNSIRNPGLKSRFNKYLEFEDYEPAELLEMLDKMCAQYGVELTDEARDYAMNLFQTTCADRPDDFANGRAVRNFFEDALTAQANRLAAENDFDEGLSIIKSIDLANAELD